MAQTFRGRARRRAREIRAAERCPVCGAAVLLGVMVDYRGERSCHTCAVKKLRGPRYLGDHPAGRREEACVDEGGADGEVYGQADGP